MADALPRPPSAVHHRTRQSPAGSPSPRPAGPPSSIWAPGRQRGVSCHYGKRARRTTGAFDPRAWPSSASGPRTLHRDRRRDTAQGHSLTALQAGHSGWAPAGAAGLPGSNKHGDLISALPAPPSRHWALESQAPRPARAPRDKRAKAHVSLLSDWFRATTDSQGRTSSLSRGGDTCSPGMGDTGPSRSPGRRQCAGRREAGPARGGSRRGGSRRGRRSAGPGTESGVNGRITVGLCPREQHGACRAGPGKEALGGVAIFQDRVFLVL